MIFLLWYKADRAADVQRETMKKKRRELEQVSLDAASDMLDTDSNATFAMVSEHGCGFINGIFYIFSLLLLLLSTLFSHEYHNSYTNNM